MKVDKERERQALMQTSRDWAKTVGGEIEQTLAYWTDDATVMPPDQPTVQGKGAIRQMLLASKNIPGFDISWEPETASISADGTMGYMVERNTVSMNDANGVRLMQPGKAVTIWRKQADGSWKCVIDIWNNNPRTPIGQ